MNIIPESNNAMLWIGELTEGELNKYIEEPGRRDDGTPQSEFARDLGRFYDHDFLWARASDREVTISELAKAIGVKDARLIEELESLVPSKSKIRCFILLWNYRNKTMLQHAFANGKLRFVGCIAYPAPFTDDF